MKSIRPLNEDDIWNSEQAGLAQFIAVNSHQLRQPMYAMNLYLATLNTFDLPDAMRAVFDNLKRCAGFFDEIFLSLLDLACLHANTMEQKSEQFPIVSVLLHVENEFANEARAKGLEFSVVPNAAWVKSDSALVKKMLSILAADAIRFTDSGKLLIGCRRKGGKLRIALFSSGNKLMPYRDDFETGESDQLWNDQFDRLDGSGVVLTLARELGQRLAAPLMFQPSSDRASMIAFDLPLWQSQAGNEVLALPVPTSDILVHKFIVVVDDNAEILNAMRALLLRWQCTVVTASSCAEVLEKLSACNQPPDVLICDYRLGQKETGLDVIRILRAEFNQNTPALLITSEVISQLGQEARAMDVHALRKPLQADELRDALRSALTASPF
jgi:CheY-like chemotaxis protein